jgi:hypothetical protein
LRPLLPGIALADVGNDRGTSVTPWVGEEAR